MELTFTLVDKSKWKTGKFIIDNLQISEELEYDDIKFYLDDKLYDGSFETWAGSKLSADDIFEQCVNAYIRNDSDDYESFSPEWSIFNKIEHLKEYQDDLLIKMPVLRYDSFEVYELDLATPYNRYYSNGDNCLLLDINGGILTDMENFYFEAIVEDICKILKEEIKCLYKGENVDYMIKEAGGKEGFLNEYDYE